LWCGVQGTSAVHLAWARLDWGGLLKTPKPLTAGSAVELVIQVSPGTPGTDVRARAVVYNVKPGEGMGVKFVQMRGDDRLRLNQFLQTQFKRF